VIVAAMNDMLVGLHSYYIMLMTSVQSNCVCSRYEHLNNVSSLQIDCISQFVSSDIPIFI
jgi:hypothetical protein